MTFHHLTYVHSPDTLEMLSRVFDEAFLLALEAREPLDDPEEQAEDVSAPTCADKHAFRVPSTPPSPLIVGRYRYLNGSVPWPAAGDDQKALRRVARKLIAMAERGDMSAIREIADRIEGKVPQAQIIQGDDDGGRVRYYAEMPVKDKTTEDWLKGNAAYLASIKLAGEA